MKANWIAGLVVLSAVSIDLARCEAPLIIPAGETVEIDGDILDHVIVHGTLRNTPGVGVMLMDGIEVYSGGGVEIENIPNTNKIYVNDISSGVFDGYLDAYFLTIGDWGTGRFVQDGGTVRAPYVFMGNHDYYASGNATYELRNGTLDCWYRLRMGQGSKATSTAHYLQTGGVANIEILSIWPESTLDMRAGSLDIGGLDLDGATYTQTGGVVVVAKDDDPYRDEDGEFSMRGGVANISGGSLTAECFSVDGGALNHSGGTVTTTDPGSLQIGQSHSGATVYNLSGDGVLTTTINGLAIGGDDGVFRQSGGELNTTQVSIGNVQHDGLGTYEISAGQADIQGTLTVGSGWSTNHVTHDVGLVDQSGGELFVGHLLITESSTYTLSGGSLSVADSIDCSGVFDFAGGAGSIAAGGIVNLSNAVGDASGTSLDVGAESLLILPPGFDPSTDFAAFTSLGIVTESGQAVDIPAGQTVTGRGWIPGHVSAAGALRATTDTKIDIEGGLSISTGGSVELGEGVVRILDDSGEISGGQLDTGEVRIGNDNAGGKTRQSGGVVTLARLYVADGESARGTYVMDDGALTTEMSILGYGGYGDTKWAEGRFEQYDGIHTTPDLHVGSSNGNHGYYLLAGGELRTETTYAGYDGHSTFVQTGGLHAVSDRLYICGGTSSYDTGRYELHAGELRTRRTNLYVYGELAEFLQTGGMHIVSQSLSTSGTYYMDGGLLETPHFQLYAGGMMVQNGGEVNADKVSIEDNYHRDTTNIYDMSAGTLNVDEMLIQIDQVQATARFAQSGGTVTATTHVLIGSRGNDSYVLSGGRLNAGELQVGVDGAGAFSIESPSAELYVLGKLRLGRDATFSAVPGATIHMTGSHFENESTDPAALAGLENISFIFEGGPGQNDTFEVAGEDLGGDDPAGLADNFTIDTLQLGGSDVGVLQLVDLFDNQADGQTVGEALYVKNLIVGPGSSLDLNGLNLYYLAADLDPTGEIIGGMPTEIIPEPATLILMAGGLPLLLKRKRKSRWTSGALGGLAVLRRRRRLEATKLQSEDA